MSSYGYTGGAQRIVTFVDNKRKVLAWGDDITDEELAPFIAHYGSAWIEPVENPILEMLAYPPYRGRS